MKNFLFIFSAIIIIIAWYFLINKNIAKIDSIPGNRLLYSGSGIEFGYPASFGANVWNSVTRPPKVTIVDKKENVLAIGCPLLEDTNIITESWGWETKHMTFTYYKWENIGAGQLYTSLCYIFSWNNVHYVIDFEIHAHNGCKSDNCWAYCGTQFEQECRDFDIAKDVIQGIEKIISTVKIKP